VRLGCSCKKRFLSILNVDSRIAKDYIEERNGGYYVAGTRISLDSIVECFNEGLSPEAILNEFDTLNLAQVLGRTTWRISPVSMPTECVRSSDPK
jgi:uncharacterized protein (DUF433 family)